VLEQIQLAPEPLEPEKLRSYEIGYLGTWLDNTLNIEVKAFREEFENEIEFTLNPFHPEPITIFNPGAIFDVNGGETQVTGVEPGVKWQATRDTRVWVSYSFAEADQQCLPLSFRCEPFASMDATPRHTANVLVAHNFGEGWQMSAGYYYLDEMSWTLWGGDLDAYDRVDARLAKTFDLQNAELKIELIGQNLGGDYTEFHARNNFETRTFLRGSLQFH